MTTPPTLPKNRGAVSIVVSTTLVASLMIGLSLSQYGSKPELSIPDDYIPVINPPPADPPPIPPPVKEEDEKKIEPPPEPPPPPPSLDQLKVTVADGVVIPVTGVTDFLNPQPIEDILDSSHLDGYPEVLRQVRPVTPRGHQRHAAEVHVSLIIDTAGNVEKAAVIKSTNAAFNGAALDAARKWVFSPGYVDGKAVKFKIIVPMVFNPAK